MINSIYLEITSACNYKCTFCPHPQMKRAKRHMKKDVAINALNQIKETGVINQVYFNYLGEPLLSPILFECLEYGKKLELNTNIITNGSLLNPESIKKIKKSNLDSIKVSYETPDKKSFKLRGNSTYNTEEVLKNTIKLIKALKATKTKIHIVLMVTGGKHPETLNNISIIDDLKSLQRLVKNLYKKIEQVTSLYPYSEIKKKVNNISWEKWNEDIQINDNIILDIRPIFNWGNVLNDKKVYPMNYGTCDQALKEEMGILVKGDVVLCCIDVEGDTKIGNITDTHLKDILSSERTIDIMNDFQNGILKLKKCQHCKGTTSYSKHLIDKVKFKLKKFI